MIVFYIWLCLVQTNYLAYTIKLDGGNAWIVLAWRRWNDIFTKDQWLTQIMNEWIAKVFVEHLLSLPRSANYLKKETCISIYQTLCSQDWSKNTFRDYKIK